MISENETENNIISTGSKCITTDLNTLKIGLSEKMKRKTELLKELSRLRKEINKDKEKLYKKCSHSYIKTYIDEGCYSKTYYSCVHCGKQN